MSTPERRYAPLYKLVPGLKPPHALSPREFTRECQALALALYRSGGMNDGLTSFALLRLEELFGEEAGEPIEKVVANDSDSMLLAELLNGAPGELIELYVEAGVRMEP